MSLGPDFSLFFLSVCNVSGYSSEAAAIIDLNLSLFIVHPEHFAHFKHYVPKKDADKRYF